MQGNVIDLAVGIIIGAAFTAIVGSLVADIINPVIGMIIGGIDFSNYYVDLSMGDYASLDAAKEAGAPLIMYGLFINAIIKFLIVAFVVFILVKNVNRLKDKMIKYLLYSFEGIYRKNVHFKDPVMIAIGYHLFPFRTQ